MDKKKILVVEDEPTTTTLLDSILKKQGYEVVIAHNGKMALSFLAGMQPDLIISDVIMPEMNGYEFFKQVRENPDTSHIPFIVLTAHAQIGNTFQELDVDAIMLKPVIANELLERSDVLLTYGRNTDESGVETDFTRKKKRSRIIFVITASALILMGLIIFVRLILARWEKKKMGEPEYILRREDLRDSFK